MMINKYNLRSNKQVPSKLRVLRNLMIDSDSSDPTSIIKTLDYLYYNLPLILRNISQPVSNDVIYMTSRKITYLLFELGRVTSPKIRRRVKNYVCKICKSVFKHMNTLS